MIVFSRVAIKFDSNWIIFLNLFSDSTFQMELLQILKDEIKSCGDVKKLLVASSVLVKENILHFLVTVHLF